ncbi:MAG: hypothetical protein C5B60_07505 [Chloroflexi bacterium]|nr:MAG: hypothetical protein C5B60_07505 [Chloroflexota bacterium]
MVDLKADAIEALQSLKKNASKIAADFPALAPFLPLAGILLHSVHLVQEATGGDTSHAVQSVGATLTPGLPNAPMLTEHPIILPDHPITADHVDNAGDAADSHATIRDAVTAVQALPDLARH